MHNDSLLLSPLVGWRTGFADAAIEVSDAIRLRRQPGSIRPLVDASGSFGGLTTPTGLAIDGDGRIYILDDAEPSIRRFDPCAGLFETLPCIGTRGSGARQLDDPHGIDITCSGDLLIADTGNARVLRYALKGLALREIITSPIAAAWEPWDVVATRDGRFYVTDHANGVVHEFDCHSRWRAAYDGSDATHPALQKPTHLAIDGQCRIYVIEEGGTSVTVLGPDGKFLATITKADEAGGRFCPTFIAVDPKGNICIADANGSLHIADADRMEDCCSCEPRTVKTPVRTSGGLAFDRDGNAILAVADRQRICAIEASVFETSGTFISDSLDSLIYNCTWHRVLLSGTVVAGTRVRVDTFTSESSKSIEEIKALPEARWATRQVDTTTGSDDWDCLVLSPPGRYLWLRLTLIGSGEATPVLTKVRAFFPRASSLRYLPAVYSTEPTSANFLGRFLSIFDALRNSVSDRIAGIETYLDPQSAPATAAADFLTWLALWIGMALDRHWPEAKRRALVKNAHRLYAMRGTPEGLKLHIELYTGKKPRVLEHFKLRRWLFLNHSRLGDQSAMWGASIVKRLQLDEFDRIGEFQLIDSGDPYRDPFHVYAHRFTVVVPARRCAGSDLERLALERIIEMAKPAHTQGNLQVTEGQLRIGVQSFIGVDTIISEYPHDVALGERHVGRDAVLGPSEDEATRPSLRIGVRSRIGASTQLR